MLLVHLYLHSTYTGLNMVNLKIICFSSLITVHIFCIISSHGSSLQWARTGHYIPSVTLFRSRHWGRLKCAEWSRYWKKSIVQNPVSIISRCFEPQQVLNICQTTTGLLTATQQLVGFVEFVCLFVCFVCLYEIPISFCIAAPFLPGVNMISSWLTVTCQSHMSKSIMRQIKMYWFNSQLMYWLCYLITY